MATGTDSHNFIVIDRVCRHWRPVSRELGVTRIAHIRGINVTGIFTTGGYAIVAGYTVINKGGMIHRCRNPTACIVAQVALLCRRNMISRFTGCY